VNIYNEKNVCQEFMVGISHRVENIFQRRCDASVENKK